MEFVRAYAADRSEQAFETLVGRYVNLVYSTAMRQVRDPHLAEEITQAVFIILARKAGKLGVNTILPSWLHRTAGFCAADALKIQRRRAQREHEAYMQSQLNEPDDEMWRQIAPLLDAAIARLSDKDRHAIVLRFFQNKSLGQIGSALGASEEAAKKRVSRALEKLQKFFFKHGITSTTATLAAAMTANSLQAAPVTLAKTASAVALTKGATVSVSTLTLIKGALKVMAWSKAKTAIVVGAGILLVAGTATMIVQHQNRGMVSPKPQPIAAGETEFPKDSWHFAGYSSPESVFMSCMWAVNNGDTNALLASVSPVERESLNREQQIISAADRQSYAEMAGYRIVDKQIVSDDKVVLVVKTGKEPSRKFLMERIGGEWKFAGRAQK